jgi:anti-sigma B factor antagonist
MAFTYTLQTTENTVNIELIGTLMEKGEAESLFRETEQLIEEGKFHFVLDLSRLEYINSSGLGVFITLLTRARKRGGEVVVSKVSKKVKELFIITKLNSLFGMQA